MSLQDAGRLAQAGERYARVLQIDPRHARAHNNLGAVLHGQGDLDGAIAHYESALRLDSGLGQACRNLGIAWFERGDLARAERFTRRALELEPASEALKRQLADFLFRRGRAAEEEERFEPAIACYAEALVLNPSFAEAALNCGVLHGCNGNLGAAFELYGKALALRPDWDIAHYNLGMLALLAGDYEQGWREYEWRWKLPVFQAQRLACPQPAWDGSAPQGRTILLYTEQGFGDAMQFVRYASRVARMGAKVLVRCPAQVVTLLREVDGVAGVVSEDDPLPDFDLHYPMQSLPFLLKTRLDTIPLDIPYLRAQDEKALAWRERLARAGGGPRIGLVWGSASGNEVFSRRKSIALESFAVLAGVRNALFVSLQKGPQAAELARPPAGLALFDAAPWLNDFSDTAAAIANLDLVITIDSAVAHLAGAMGRPVWTLVSLPLMWPWASSDGSCYWYPTMRLFRQHRFADWSGALREVAAALAREKLECSR